MAVLTRLLVVAAIMIITGAGAAVSESLKQVAAISIPGPPINQYGVLAIDQASGRGYVGDKDNKAIVVFDTKTDAFVSRIEGFVGLTKDGNASGPNGVIVANNGAELWVSDGDSTIKVVDLKSGKIVSAVHTGGKLRANGMAYAPEHQVAIVANSNEEPPFLSLVSTKPDRKILAKIPMPESGENLERSVYHAPSGMFYTAIPVLARDKSKGILAQVDAKNAKLVKLHELEGCNPHSLQMVSDTTIFLGCSSNHGPTPKPGGNLGVFDIPSSKVVEIVPDLGGNGSSDFNPKLARYYHSTSASVLIIVDAKTKQLVQRMPTSAGARFIGASFHNDRVYLPTTAKDGPCGGCILVYAHQ